MAKDKRERIQRYFRFSKKGPVWCIIIGIILLPVIIGLFLILFGVFALLGSRGIPKDRQIDRWTDEDINGLNTQALNKTGLSQDDLISDQVVVTGLRFWNVGGAELGVKLGKDDRIRFTPVGVTIINFTQHQLVAYQCALDLMTGNPLSESTEEYFYRDVVSVSTQAESKSWDKSMLSESGLKRTPLSSMVRGGKLQFNAAETFVLTTSGGTSLEVVLRDPTLIEAAGGGYIPTELADKAIKSVRRMLREKKAS
jgi:hypothetical protein